MKTIKLIIFLTLLVICLLSCSKAVCEEQTTENTASPPQTEKVELFFESGLNDSEIKSISAEAFEVMRDIENYLDIHLEADGIPLKCIFDPEHKMNGEIRSEYNNGTIWCTEYCDLPHEYTHMLCDLNNDTVYTPDKMIIEGFASYVDGIWNKKIKTKEYQYFSKAEIFPYSSDINENNQILSLIEESKLDLTSLNYKKAIVYLVYNATGNKISVITDEYFINYYLGHILVEYLIENCGGISKFIEFYCDSVRVNEIYEKSIDDLIKDALDNNSDLFKHASRSASVR